jgi:hypothetical protein
MRTTSMAVFFLFMSSVAFAACDPTDLEENVKWCSINAAFPVKAAFCRELQANDAGQAFSSFGDCEASQGDHEKIMNNARECALNPGVPSVLDMLKKYRGNLGC